MYLFSTNREKQRSYANWFMLLPVFLSVFVKVGFQNVSRQASNAVSISSLFRINIGRSKGWHSSLAQRFSMAFALEPTDSNDLERRATCGQMLVDVELCTDLEVCDCGAYVVWTAPLAQHRKGCSPHM
eukprot:jgi/Botrbrau1/10261/Bobra.0140s0015.1